MIGIDRSQVPRPVVLSDEPRLPASQERAKAATFVKRTEKARGQQLFLFKVYRDWSVFSALTELFHGKCAYCEAEVGMTSPVEVEQLPPHLRPRRRNTWR